MEARMSTQPDEERHLIISLREITPPIAVRTRIRARIVALVAAGRGWFR